MSSGHGGQRAGAGRPEGRVSEAKLRLSRKSLAIGEDGTIEWSDVLADVQPEDLGHLVWQPRID